MSELEVDISGVGGIRSASTRRRRAAALHQTSDERQRGARSREITAEAQVESRRCVRRRNGTVAQDGLPPDDHKRGGREAKHKPQRSDNADETAERAQRHRIGSTTADDAEDEGDEENGGAADGRAAKCLDDGPFGVAGAGAGEGLALGQLGRTRAGLPRVERGVDLDADDVRGPGVHGQRAGGRGDATEGEEVEDGNDNVFHVINFFFKERKRKRTVCVKFFRKNLSFSGKCCSFNFLFLPGGKKFFFFFATI